MAFFLLEMLPGDLEFCSVSSSNVIWEETQTGMNCACSVHFMQVLVYHISLNCTRTTLIFCLTCCLQLLFLLDTHGLQVYNSKLMSEGGSMPGVAFLQFLGMFP